MSLTSTITEVTYDCDGSTVDFPITYGFFQRSDIKCFLIDVPTETETELTEGTDYTISTIYNDYRNGGTLTTVATYGTDKKIRIERAVPMTQELDFTKYDAFRSEDVENALDKLTMVDQQIESKIKELSLVTEEEKDQIELNTDHREGDGTDHAQVAQNAVDIDGKIDDIWAGENISIDKTDPKNPIIASTGGGSGGGDMLKSVYDTDNNGIVDNSEKLEGKTALELPVSTATQSALDDKLTSVSSAETDLNNITTHGIYQVDAQTNVPLAGTGNLTVYEYGSDIVQIWIPSTGNPPIIYTRKYLSGLWQDWVLTSANHLTQVDLFVGGKYGASVQTDLLWNLMNTKFTWRPYGTWLLDSVIAVHKTDDGTSNPSITLTVNGTSVTTATQLGASGVWTDITVNADVFIDNTKHIDIDCTTAGGGGDAENLTVALRLIRVG